MDAEHVGLLIAAIASPVLALAGVWFTARQRERGDMALALKSKAEANNIVGTMQTGIIADLGRYTTHLKEQIAELERVNSELRLQIADLKTESGNLRTESNILRTENVQLRADIQRLGQRIDDLTVLIRRQEQARSPG